jgi:polysaccharide export outer membrane protein
MIALSHSYRALAAGSLAFLFAAAPLATLAQGEPTNPVVPLPMPSAAPASAPGTESVTPVNATISPGDHLAIGVYNEPSLTNTAIVQSDGTIQYSLIGRVKLAGLTPVQAQETLSKSFSHFLRHPVVSVSIAQQGVISVVVMGNVRGTGRYQIRSGAHVTEAIAAAGGISQFNGGFPTARVLENDGTIAVADLQKLLRGGDATQNVPVSDNAMVYVTGAETIRVQVLGAVTRPGNVDVFEGDRLSMALARAGAEAQAKPDLNHVFIRRKDLVTGKSASYEIDMFKALKGGNPQYDPILQKDDTVYVPEARQVSSTTIGLLGILGRLVGL